KLLPDEQLRSILLPTFHPRITPHLLNLYIHLSTPYSSTHDTPVVKIPAFLPLALYETSPAMEDLPSIASIILIYRLQNFPPLCFHTNPFSILQNPQEVSQFLLPAPLFLPKSFLQSGHKF